MLERLLCIDFEASALENGYPIEVGVAEVATGAVRSWLIRPSETWLAGRIWSPASEKVHGISRSLLEAEGKPPEAVWAALAPALAGKLLVSDNPPFDGRWLRMLSPEAAASVLEDMDGIAWGLAVKSGRRPDIAWEGRSRGVGQGADSSPRRAGCSPQRSCVEAHRGHEIASPIIRFMENAGLVACVSRRRKHFEQVALSRRGSLQGAVAPVIVQQAEPDTNGFRRAHVVGEFLGSDDVESALQGFGHSVLHDKAVLAQREWLIQVKRRWRPEAERAGWRTVHNGRRRAA